MLLLLDFEVGQGRTIKLKGRSNSPSASREKRQVSLLYYLIFICIKSEKGKDFHMLPSPFAPTFTVSQRVHKVDRG